MDKLERRPAGHPEINPLTFVTVPALHHKENSNPEMQSRSCGFAGSFPEVGEKGKQEWAAVTLNS